jgi:hypothetical protein
MTKDPKGLLRFLLDEIIDPIVNDLHLLNLTAQSITNAK